MNISEASVVNRLVDHLFELPHPGPREETDEASLRRDAVFLIERAHKALHAGALPAEVEAAPLRVRL